MPSITCNCLTESDISDLFDLIKMISYSTFYKKTTYVEFNVGLLLNREKGLLDWVIQIEEHSKINP